MKKLFLAFDQKCERNLELLSLWLLIIILRIPNFFEPYWYGDEAIYLTLGVGLRQGLSLYTDIIDHKTPLIYYLAMVPDQFSFRLLNFFWMLVTTTLFYFFAKKLFQNSRHAFFGSLIFVFLTTLPWFEGHIPNGELFVLGFVMAALSLLSNTSLFQKFFKDREPQLALKASSLKENVLILSSGVFLGLGILTKVPALLDFGSVLLIGWFAFTQTLKGSYWKENISGKLKAFLSAFGGFFKKSVLLFAGVMLPILLSIVYFVSIGSGKDYLDYGLLYNIRYSGSWQPTLPNATIQFLFTLPGKVLIMAGIIFLLSFARKRFTPAFQFIASWFTLTLFASLLSNRPYPHYLIQVVPAFSLLVVQFFRFLPQAKKHSREILFSILLFLLPVSVMLLLKVQPYETGRYYSQFYKLVSKQITMDEYDRSFNGLVEDNYKVAQIIRGMNIDRIFIWGTNPMLYALSQTTPTSRFTVSFHIKDFKDHENTLRQIKEEKPKIIVVMKDENEVFKGLEEYLNASYYPNDTQYDTMTVYLRKSESAAYLRNTKK